MPTSKGLRRLVLACALSSMLILASCATLTTLIGGRTERVDVNAVACGAFAPITWADADTDDTIRQVRAHNAAWMALCSDGAAPP